MTGDKGNGERWLNIAGSLASLAALGYLLTHLPRRGERGTPVAGLGAGLPTRGRGLGDVPKFPGFKFKLKRTRDGDEYRHELMVFDKAGEPVGDMDAGHCFGGEWATIGEANIAPSMRGKGLYPAMLTKMRDFVKKKGCVGLVSLGGDRIGEQSTASWEKFAKREPRVRREADDYYFSGLPTRGRIPLATAKRAINRLGRKAKSCGITPNLLREGMEIEREHRDVTGGRVGTTAKIAAAHICEDKQYYRKLKRYIEK